MSKSIYFVSSANHWKFLPNFEALARMNRRPFLTNTLRSPFDTSPLTRPIIKAPFNKPPAGMTFASAESSYELVDIPCDLGAWDVESDEIDDCDADGVIENTGPEWLRVFEAHLKVRQDRGMQQPVIFHLRTISTPEISEMVEAVCTKFELPFTAIQGNEHDHTVALFDIKRCASLVTYLNNPDPIFLQSSWQHQRLGNVWFWVSPFALVSKLLTPSIPLPFSGEHAENALPEGTVAVADQAALIRQINELAAAKNEGQKGTMLKDLCQPKRLRIASQEDVDAMVDLRAELPQFTNLLNKVVRRIVLQAVNDQPLHLGNLLLVGEPGNGKSWLCSKIAHALSLPFLTLQLAGNSDSMVLRGSQPQWSNADAGRPAKFLATCSIANPIIMLDEVDKTGSSQHGSLTDTILMLLEPENACRFMDNFVETPIDMHYISFILTANNIEALSDPLQSRVEVDYVHAPTKDEMCILAQKIYQQELANKKVAEQFVPEIGEAELVVLVAQSDSIRALRQQVVLAIENGLGGYTDVATIRSMQNTLRPIPIIAKPIMTKRIGFLGH